MERSAVRTSKWGSWRLAAVFVGLLAWLVVPPGLRAIGLTGVWSLIAFIIAAIVLIVLATIRLVPKADGRAARISPRSGVAE